LASLTQTKDSLRQLVIDAYRDEHGERIANWRNVETKAQGNVAVAGIFIAGVFAFITKSGEALTHYENFILLIAVLFLISSVIFSILVLQIRTIPEAPLGSFLDYTVKRLLPLDPDEFFERVSTFNAEHSKEWRTVTNETIKILQLKADRLWIAQRLLVIAISSVALATVIRLAHWGTL